MVIHAFTIPAAEAIDEAIRLIVDNARGTITRTTGMIVPNWHGNPPSEDALRVLIEKEIHGPNSHPVFVRSLTGCDQTTRAWKLRSFVINGSRAVVLEVGEHAAFPVKLRGHTSYADVEVSHDLFTLAWAIGHRRTNKVELRVAEYFTGSMDEKKLMRSLETYRKGIWHLVKLSEMPHFPSWELRERQQILRYAWAQVCFREAYFFANLEPWSSLGGRFDFDMRQLFRKHAHDPIAILQR